MSGTVLNISWFLMLTRPLRLVLLQPVCTSATDFSTPGDGFTFILVKLHLTVAYAADWEDLIDADDGIQHGQLSFPAKYHLQT